MTIKQQQPNIIFVMLDTLRADRLCCYGYSRSTSPNIDRIARQGLLFENAIASAPWTLPCHASLFTGLYPTEHNATDENPFLRRDVPTLAELLRESGYQTVAYAPANGWLSDDTSLMRGFDTFYGPSYRPPAPGGNPLINKIRWKIKTILGLPTDNPLVIPLNLLKKHLAEQRQNNPPLFFFLHTMETHMPYRPDIAAMRKFGLDKAAPADIEYLQREFRQYRTDPQSLGDKRMKILRDLYDACVLTADRRLGPLFELVRSPALRDNTVLIITADHGEHLGEHGLLNHWLSLHDTLLRVPLIIWSGAKIPAGVRIANQVQQLDLFYTLLELASYGGQSVKGDRIGSHSLFQMAAGNSPFPEYTYAHQSYAKMTLEHIRKYNPSFDNELLICPKYAVRSNHFKYIRYGIGYEELFDIRSDPGETRNIIADHRDIAATFRTQLNAMPVAEKTPADKRTDIDDFDSDVKKRLMDLGYL